MPEPKSEMSRREEYAEATRQALLSVAREIFTREGYQAAGIEAIARAARVTRGAFYHHFEDKKALFDAVVVSLQAETTARIEQRSRPQRKIWDRMSVGIDAYLDACLEPAYGRIVIHEAPAVLGNKRFRVRPCAASAAARAARTPGTSPTRSGTGPHPRACG